MKKITKYIEGLAKVRTKKKALDDQIKKLEEKIDDLEERIIGEMLNAGVQSINLAEVGTVFLSKSEYPSIEDVPTFYKYLRESNQGDMIKETVHPSTLRGWWNNLVEQENHPVADTIGLAVYSKTKVSIRKN